MKGGDGYGYVEMVALVVLRLSLTIGGKLLYDDGYYYGEAGLEIIHIRLTGC